MSPTADTIWSVPAYLPYLQPPLTDEAVASVEKQIGYKLPSEYLNLLASQNGGCIRYSLPEIPHRMIAGIGPHFPSLVGFRWKRKGLVPFDGDGHWHLCFDYRKNSITPAVTYSDNEIRSESRIADSFAGYLAKLKIAILLRNTGRNLFWKE